MTTPPGARPLRGLLLDMDGVVYRGNSLTPGAADFFSLIRRCGLRVSLTTNNSLLTSSQYVDKLASLGIAVQQAEVFTAGQAVARYLVATAPAGSRVLALGGEGLLAPLRDGGFVLTEERPDFVVLGLDLEFDYARLRLACSCVRSGAKLICANKDRTLPVENGEWPGTGSLAAAIEVGSGQRAVVIGKPQPLMLRLALSAMGLRPAQVALVGDRLETDVLAAKRAGIASVLVLTGVTTLGNLGSSRIQPDVVCRDLNHLGSILSESEFDLARVLADCGEHASSCECRGLRGRP